MNPTKCVAFEIKENTVGSIFFELQETDSDLDDDLDWLDPDTDHQELRQPVEWLQPSCTSGAKYNADVRSTEREGKIEYPTCSRQFRIDEAFMLMNGPIHSGRSREMVLKLRHLKEKEEAVRVTVRRRKIWDDFKRSRERYYTTDRILKATFSWEPAVDSGGPKRVGIADVLSYVEARLFVEGIPSKSTISLNCGDFKSSSTRHPKATGSFVKLQRATNEGLPEISQEEFPYPFLEEVGYSVCPQGDTKICCEP
ncbi:hypothetical protein P5673_006197 [Acropora cervicornis]|uniref:Uncharacterized protein n=1 Tax=Acropora cervicornis TaxID=6130 RepID=A0AAD9QY81_ACRCE|nr:hypothetical protein P5673_006197 [Acropora cervicornis]